EIAAFGPDEETHHGGDIVGAATPASKHRACAPMLGLAAFTRRVDHAGRDEIGGGAARGGVDGERLGETRQTRLWGDHMRAMGRADMGGRAADIDNGAFAFLERW